MIPPRPTRKSVVRVEPTAAEVDAAAYGEGTEAINDAAMEPVVHRLAADVEPAQGVDTSDVEGASEADPTHDADTSSTPETSAIYFGECRLLNWSTTAKGGMKTDLNILDCPPDGLHPFKGLYCGKQNGQRLKVWFGELAEGDNPMTVTHQGEALLLRWSDDSVNGMSVQFLLDNGPDGIKGAHPFEGLSIGRVEGERLKMACFAINDDESVIDPRKTRKKKPFYQRSETEQAHIMCRNPRFISYVRRHQVRLTRGQEIKADITVAPDEYITEAIYTILGITSRAVLGYDNADGRRARTIWASLTSEYFDDYYNRR